MSLVITFNTGKKIVKQATLVLSPQHVLSLYWTARLAVCEGSNERANLLIHLLISFSCAITFSHARAPSTRTQVFLSTHKLRFKK